MYYSQIHGGEYSSLKINENLKLRLFTKIDNSHRKSHSIIIE